jgi:EamA domain-containing membrane protein RarD
VATRTAFAVGSGTLWRSPALIDGLLAYAVAMAVGVAVFTNSVGSQPWPAYVFALGFGLILLIRRRYPVPVLILTSLGICVYYVLQYPPIGLALPIAAALFSAAEASLFR